MKRERLTITSNELSWYNNIGNQDFKLNEQYDDDFETQQVIDFLENEWQITETIL